MGDDPPIVLPAPDAPDTPGTVRARLAYAQSQVEAEGGDCAQRLAAAQAQRDLAVASPLVDLVVSAGRARVASIDYRLHLDRAYCGTGAAPRLDELRAALDAAQSAVSLYRQGYDYQSMAVMQYDVATTWRLLGDRDKAVAALTEALGMDGEFGFAADAAENGELLRRWQDQPAVPPPAAAPRSVTLKFAWMPAEAGVVVKADYFALVKGAVLRSAASATSIRHVRADGDDWILSSEPGERRYDFDEWHDRPDPSRQRTLAALAAGQMVEPGIKVGATGDFKDVVDAAKTTEIVAGDLGEVTGDLSLPMENSNSLDLTELYGRSVEMLSVSDGLKAKASADYAITTSTWIDATLEQGVWYDMTASLFAPAMAMWIDHDIQFSYSRPVPCTEGVARTACVEILVHATPNAQALAENIGYMKRALRLGQARMRYESATDLRLVVDPARLLPYGSEVRAHWYFSIEGKGEPLIGSETLVSTYAYR